MVKLFAIGYAGRDKEKTWEHIEELKEIGVPEPSSVPELYALSPSLIDQSEEISVVGNKTSGEAEIVLIFDENGDVKVTVGSDHTDRDLETVSIQKSKQICDKPLAKETIDLADIEDEWDDIKLYCDVLVDGEWQKYQEGTFASIIPLDEILNFLEKHDVPKKDAIVYSGTVPLINGFVYGDGYRCGIHSDKLDKTISIEYKLDKLKE